MVGPGHRGPRRTSSLVLMFSFWSISYLHGQTVAVPSEAPRHVVPRGCLVPRHDVF